MSELSVNGVSGDGYAPARATELKEFKKNQELMFEEYKKQQAPDVKTDEDTLKTPVNDGEETKPLSKADQILVDSNKVYLETLNSKKVVDSGQKDNAQQELDLIKMMGHLSDETRSYLEKDQNFQDNEKSIQDAIAQRNKHNATIPELRQKYIAAEKEYKKLVSEGKFDAAQKALDACCDARDNYDAAIIVLDVMDGSIDKASQYAFVYATTIERWEDGNVVKLTRESVGNPEIDNVYNKEFKMVTLENGQKAYESEGKYYQLADDGLPNPYMEIEQ